MAHHLVVTHLPSPWPTYYSRVHIYSVVYCIFVSDRVAPSYMCVTEYKCTKRGPSVSLTSLPIAVALCLLTWHMGPQALVAERWDNREAEMISSAIPTPPKQINPPPPLRHHESVKWFSDRVLSSAARRLPTPPTLTPSMW